MTRSLTFKLTLAFVAVGLTVALLVAVFIRLNNAQQLGRLVVDQQRSEFQSLLVTYYETNGSWDGVLSYVAQAQGIPFLPPEGDQGRQPPPGDNPDPLDIHRQRREMFGLADAQGIMVIPMPPNLAIGTRVSPAMLAQGQSIEVDGQVVGTILTAQGPPGLSPEETAYLQRANLALLLASGGAVLIALIVGALLARTLTRPLRALTAAAHRMAGGELEQSVSITSGDEIGELGAAFNRMSREVARANTARRQMTADIAHELRTPLTVVSGYVESMRDGVLAATPERLSVIYSEIEHLQHLVGDLRTLTQADAGELKLHRQPVAPLELLEQAEAAFEHQAAQAGVRLEVNANGGLPPINVDETRLAQVLSNLITNALRFTPRGGRITLTAAPEGGRVMLAVRDSGRGIAPEDLPFVFNRFYRADKSRSEDNGESGLGLAIVKALVEAHGGKIDVTSTPGQGTAFTIHLPIVP
jgi:two-component system sensor histidine kinase BaeS